MADKLWPVADRPMGGTTLTEVGERQISDGAETGLTPESRTTPPSRRRLILEWMAILSIALAVAAGLKLWVLQSYSIPSDSMVPTLNVGDHILVNKLAYRTHALHRGDVVVFTRPRSLPRSAGEAPHELIKRVIGLPGDTVETRDGAVLVNGRPLIEPYLRSGSTTDRFEAPVVVAVGQVLVLGDNRAVSADSRVFGTIAESTIVGRAVVRVWPLNRVSFL
jgi:signal peptidase I